MVSNNMRGLQYNMEAFLLPFTLQLCFKYVLWDDWGTTKPFKELCGSVVLLVNFGDKTMKLHSFCQGQGQGAAAPTTAKSH